MNKSVAKVVAADLFCLFALTHDAHLMKTSSFFPFYNHDGKSTVQKGVGPKYIHKCQKGYLQFFRRLFAFSEVQCGDPMSVKDGFIEVSNFKGKYVFGSLATYHCNPGYILWGNASRLCAEDGTWTGIKPQCKPITCGQPPEVSNTRFQLMNGSTSWQSLAKYTCKPGHSMVYEKRMLSNIFWY